MKCFKEGDCVIKAIRLLATSLFGSLLCLYFTAFMWLEVPKTFFKVVDVIGFFIFSIYMLLKVIESIIKEIK